MSELVELARAGAILAVALAVWFWVLPEIYSWLRE